MAHLTERGQMILVGGLAVAVSIVVLVVLLNSVIFTQNVATRSGDADTHGVLEYRAVLVDGTADLLDAENERPYEDYAPLRANVTTGIENISTALRGQLATSLVAEDLEAITLHDGTRVVQSNASRDLTNASGAANWTVATDAAGVRSFVLTATDAEGGLLALDPTDGSTHIEVTGNSGNVWRLFVYEESATGDTHLAVKNGSTANVTDPACGGGDVTNDTIDLVAGTVAGADCPALAFAEGTTGPVDVSVVYGDKADGNYRLTVNTTNVGDLAAPGTSDSPRWEPMVYGASLNVSYRTPELLYEARIRVTPGEDDA